MTQFLNLGLLLKIVSEKRVVIKQNYSNGH